MPVAAACPKCQKKYNLPDKMLGKPVKCTQCATQFRTPAPTQGHQRQADPRQVALQQQAAAAARKRAAELQKMGVDGPIQKTPDVFDGLSPMQGTADPLNNMALEDPGFADVRSQAVVIDEGPVDPNADMFANPALAPKKKKAKKKSKSKTGNAPLYLEPWFWISVILLPLFGAIALLAWLESVSYETGVLLFVVALVLFGLASLGVSVYGVILCYRNTPSVSQVLLFLFLPFYMLYYLIKHRDPMKSFGNALTAQFVVAVVATFAAKLLENLKEV